MDSLKGIKELVGDNDALSKICHQELELSLLRQERDAYRAVVDKFVDSMKSDQREKCDVALRMAKEVVAAYPKKEQNLEAK